MISITIFASITGIAYASSYLVPSHTYVRSTEQEEPPTSQNESPKVLLADTAAETSEANDAEEELPKAQHPLNNEQEPKQELPTDTSNVFTVPFFSQFTDITAPEWKKIGCGIASLAMLIDFYQPGEVVVDTLLRDGINAGAYLSNAGWTHAGLINLSKKYGLGGASHDMAGLGMNAAFTKLQEVVTEGPVMVSVHYTFDPKNPIPHLVVVNGVHDGKVYYNDPAEVSAGGSISIEQFQSSWKKRYIEIRPAA